MTLLVAGEGGHSLAQKLAHIAKWSVVDAEVKSFPDGEQYARIPTSVQGKDVVVVQTGYPPSRLWTLLMLLNAAREGKAASVRCVVPYMPYARQDRLFLEGEALTAKLVGQSLRTWSDQCLTVELHKDEVARYFDGRCLNLSAAAPFADEFRQRQIDVVLAPDAGARQRAEQVALRLGAEADHLEKKRLSGESVEIRPKSLNVKGRRVAILDDIISTGSTMAKACEQLVQQGAATVVCAGVHGLFIGDAVQRLKSAGASEIICADTIDSPYSRVSVAPILAEALAAKSLAR